MKTNRSIIIISILIIAVSLASCTQNNKIAESTTNENLNSFANVSDIADEDVIPKPEVVIPKEEFKETPKNFSVVEPKEEPVAKDESYDTSRSITTKDNCFDSDGSFNFLVKGYIKDTEGNVFKDYCKNGAELVEYKCGMIGYKEQTEDTCNYGCVDGACRQPTEDEICKDSDNGKVFTTKGTVFYLGKAYEDSCKSDKYLNEQFCTNIGVNGVEEKLCEDGCLDGACVVKTIDNKATCKDSDFGEDEEYTIGQVTDSKGTVTDTCMNSRTVEEYKCNVVGYRMKQNVVCPYTHKCQDGACVEI